MISDWEEVRLEDITSILGDGLHGTPNYDENGEYYFINGNNLDNGKIIFDEKTKRASREEYLKYKKTLNERTILVSINGTIGNVGLYNGEKVFLGKSACYFNVIENVDKQFIRYVVTDKYFQNYIHSLATGSTIKNVSLKLMRNFTFKLPPLEIQKEISKVLENLDNKIELNRQINQTLEQIAQAIFKSWFVDFDPVKAKIQAKEQGHDSERAAMEAIAGKGVSQYAPTEQLSATAALFPDELVESELGLIPKGWEVGTLDEVSHLNMTSWTKKTAPSEVWYVDLANTKNGIIEEVQYYSWDNSPSRARRILKSGDTIIGIVRPGNRSFALIGNTSNQLTASTGFAVLTPRSKEYIEFIYIAATSDSNIERLAHLADGAAYPAVRPDVVSQMKCMLPSDKVVQAFSEMTRPLFNLRENNQAQADLLANCRDSLLPKLLSGELELKEAEQKAETMA